MMGFLAFVRLNSNAVSDTDRTVHLVAMPQPDAQQAAELSAALFTLCGKNFRPYDIERYGEQYGTACRRCLAAAAQR